MPSAATERDGDPVGCRREGAAAQPDVTDIQGGVAVDAEDGVDALDPSRLDDPLRSTGDDLFGRLEDQADAGALCRQGVHVLVQRQTSTENCGDVKVMAAGVADPLIERGKRQAGSFGHRQRVQVGPQSHAVCRVGRADVGHQPARKQPHPDTSRDQPVRDHRRGSDLVARQLRVGMEVAAELDELVRQTGQRPAHDFGDRGNVALWSHER